MLRRLWIGPVLAFALGTSIASADGLNTCTFPSCPTGQPLQSSTHTPADSTTWTDWGASAYVTVSTALDTLSQAVRALWLTSYGTYNAVVNLDDSSVWTGFTRTTYTGNPCKAMQAALKIAFTGNTTLPAYNSQTNGQTFRMKVVGDAIAYSADWRRTAADEMRVCLSIFESRTWADNTGAVSARAKVTVSGAAFRHSDIGKAISWSSGGAGTIVAVDTPTTMLYTISAGAVMTSGNTMTCDGTGGTGTCYAPLAGAATSAYTYGWAPTTEGVWPVPDREQTRYSRSVYIDFDNAYLYIYNDNTAGRSVLLEVGNGYEFGVSKDGSSGIRTSTSDFPMFYGGQNFRLQISGKLKWINATASSNEPYTYTTGTPVGLPLATRSPAGTLIGMLQTDASYADMSDFELTGSSLTTDHDDIGLLRMNSGWSVLKKLTMINGGTGVMLYGYNQGSIRELHAQSSLRGFMAGDPYNGGGVVMSTQCRQGSRLTVATNTFVPSDVGQAIEWGPTNSGNGIIQAYVSATQIDYRITDLADTYVAAGETVDCHGCATDRTDVSITQAGTYCGRTGSNATNAGGFTVEHAISLEGGSWGNVIIYGGSGLTIADAWIEQAGANGLHNGGAFEDMAPSVCLGCGAVVNTSTGAGSWAPCYAYAKDTFTCIPPPFLSTVYGAVLNYSTTNYYNASQTIIQTTHHGGLLQKQPDGSDDTVMDHTGVSRSLSSPGLAIGPGGQRFNALNGNTAVQRHTIVGGIGGSDADNTTNTASGKNGSCRVPQSSLSGIKCALFLVHPSATVKLDLSQVQYGWYGARYAMTVTGAAFVDSDISGGKRLSWANGGGTGVNGVGMITGLVGAAPTETVYYEMQDLTHVPPQVGTLVSCNTSSYLCNTQFTDYAVAAAYNADPYISAGVKVDITKTGSAYNVVATPTLNTDADNFYQHALYPGDETECQNVDAATIDAGATNIPLFSALGTSRQALFLGCRCVSGTCTTVEAFNVKNANGNEMRMPTNATCAKPSISGAVPQRITWRSVRSRSWINPGDTILGDGTVGASATAGLTQVCLRTIQGH